MRRAVLPSRTERCRACGPVLAYVKPNAICGPAIMRIWAQNYPKFCQKFQTLDTDHDGFISGAEARPVLTASGLATGDLRRIWVCSYAMSGTDTAYGSRVCSYAMSGTDTVYGGRVCSYAMSGTDTAYGSAMWPASCGLAMQCPELADVTVDGRLDQ
eukprot:3277217-Rhodomonas_salina.1